MGDRSLQGTGFRKPWIERLVHSLILPQSLLLDPKATITDEWIDDESTDQGYVALTANGGFSFLNLKPQALPSLPVGKVGTIKKPEASRLHFIPYFYRANRGGKGQLRVGIRRLHRDT
jgi:hypothetical protein